MKKGQTSKLFNSNINLSLSAFGVSLFAMFTSATLLSLPSTHAETTVTSATTSANASVTVPSACTLSGGGNSYSAEIPGGTTKEFGGVTGETDYPGTPIKATCNDPNGYALYAIGYSGHNYTTPTNNQLIATNTGSSNNISTGTSGSNSYWAFKLAPVTGTYAPTIISPYTGYANVPATYAKVAQFPSATDLGSSATGSAIKAYYEVHIASNQAPDTYTGAVKYTLVHPSTAPAPILPVVTDPGFISYNPNAAGVTDTMGDQSISSSVTSADLWASNFQRPGYGFAGWSETFDYSDSTKFHGPNETISFTAGQYSGSNPGLSLYAIWVPSAGDLQNWTGCSALTKANEATDILSQSITALTDTRDNQTYAVARLADGNCWMIENLRLADQTASGAPITINSSNTNNPISTFTQLSTSVNPTSTAWCNTDDSACDDQSMLFSGNTTNPASNMTTSDESVYSYGNYYNWYSATAGNGTHSKLSGNTVGDICPIGWHLPTGNSLGNFSSLDSAMGGTGGVQPTTESNRWRKYPQNFVYSGFVRSDSVGKRGISGTYWSSSAGGTNGVYALRLYRGENLIPGVGSVFLRRLGNPVRCLNT